MPTVDVAEGGTPPEVVAPPPRTLELLNRATPITYESAIDTDANIIREAAYVAACKALYNSLWRERRALEAAARHHLGLAGTQDVCKVARPAHWIRGSFNVCIPIEVQSQSPDSSRKLMIRCAMPHKLAEANYPGTVDEKMACEVGAYVWMQERCPDIPIPRLYGFGFSDHRHFTHKAYRPWYVRTVHYLRRVLSNFIGRPGVFSQYTSHIATHRLPTAYMLLENVGSDTSKMLSRTWNEQRGDPARRQTLFRGMARIMLSLARIPQPRIGSFCFHNDGSITLTNRPLITAVMILENEGTPRVMQKNDTYTFTEPFVADLFKFHDERFINYRNVIFDDKDCRSKMSAKVLLRSLAHHYIRRERRSGPFLLQLTDLHASNIFVDDNWNITRLVDLEWVCALPSEAMDVPYWLTGCGIDDVHGEALTEYEKVREEFVHVFDEEERNTSSEHGLSLAQNLRDHWKSGATWFWHCLESTNAMSPLFRQHICPKFLQRDLLLKEEATLYSFWSENGAEVVKSKVDEYNAYAKELQELFDRVTPQQPQ